MLKNERKWFDLMPALRKGKDGVDASVFVVFFLLLFTRSYGREKKIF